MSVNHSELDQAMIRRYVRVMWDMTIEEQMQYITLVEESRDLDRAIKRIMLKESWKIITHHLGRSAG